MPSDILWQRQGLQRLGTDWVNHETWQDFSKFLLNSWNRPDRPPPNNFLRLSLKCSSSTAASFIICNLATRDKLVKLFQMARRSRSEYLAVCSTTRWCGALERTGWWWPRVLSKAAEAAQGQGSSGRPTDRPAEAAANGRTITINPLSDDLLPSHYCNQVD